MDTEETNKRLMTKFIDVSVSTELATDYVTYAASTANRAIPDVVDGLKAVQRRIIQSAFDLKLWADSSYKKVSRLDGHTVSYYSPHGSAAGAIINLGDPSDFLSPMMMIHGNQGGVSTTSRQKISSDAPAAARYLECKLSEFGQAVFDIPLKYLPTRPNYDGTTQEVRQYCPALPLALLTPQQGIGVGYSVNSIGFVASDIVKAIKVVGNDAKVAKALGTPDVPYNTRIINDDSVANLHTEGRGSISLVGDWVVDRNYDSGSKRNRYREAIIITKLATGNVEQLIEKLKKAFEDGKIENIANIIDETSKDIRVVVVLKAKTKAESVLPDILKTTNLKGQQSAKYTLVNGMLPQDFTPSQILSLWYDARCRVLLNKFGQERDDLNKRLVVVKGILSVFSCLRDVALLIMESDNPDQAKANIMAKYSLVEPVAVAILNIQLKSLTKLNKDELVLEAKELKAEIERLTTLIVDKEALNKEVIRMANKVAKLCSGRVSEVIDNVPKIKTKAKTKKLDLVSQAVKDSVAKMPNGKKSPKLSSRAFTNAIRQGRSINDRLQEHLAYHRKRNPKNNH